MKLSPQELAEIVAALQADETVASDKRRFPRSQVNGKVELTPISNGQMGKPYTALTRDVSQDGVGLLQSSQTAVAQSIRVRLSRKGSPPLVATARVMHVRAVADGLYAVGCQFVTSGDGI